MDMPEWTTSAVAPTSGTQVNVWQWGDGSVTTEAVVAVLLQQRIWPDGERETRTQFGTQVDCLPGEIRAVADVLAERGGKGIAHRATVPAGQLEETLAAIASEAAGGNGQHERARRALGQVRRAVSQGRTPQSVDVSTALACACTPCLAGNAELAAELAELGVL